MDFFPVVSRSLEAVGADTDTKIALAVFLFALGSLLCLYFGFALSTLTITKILLPRLRIGKIVDPRPLKPGQIALEIAASLRSIVIFALLAVLTFKAYRAGVVTIVWQASLGEVFSDLGVLFLWNELHFYCSHRLLHTRWLFQHVHIEHHRSVVPTPFSTYSFHWFEAVLLGSVMITGMLWYDFSFAALLSLAITSLAINTLGHANYEAYRLPFDRVYTASRRHAQHHRDSRGNYGFLLPQLDMIFGSFLTNREPEVEGE